MMRHGTDIEGSQFLFCPTPCSTVGAYPDQYFAPLRRHAMMYSCRPAGMAETGLNWSGCATCWLTNSGSHSANSMPRKLRF